MAGTPEGARLQLYGRRRGRRLRAGQQELLAELLPKLRIALPERGERLDLAALFGPAIRDVWFEIGFGGGEHLAWQAERNPDVGFIGAEFFLNGVVSLLGHLARGGIGNVRIHPEDARPLLHALPDQSIGRAFLLFPDPWPKKRHHKRRLVQPAFAALAARKLAAGGYLHAATDWEDYALQIEQVLAGEPQLERASAAARPATKFELRGLRLGHRVRDLLFRKR